MIVVTNRIGGATIALARTPTEEPHGLIQIEAFVSRLHKLQFLADTSVVASRPSDALTLWLGSTILANSVESTEFIAANELATIITLLQSIHNSVSTKDCSREAVDRLCV